MNPFVFKKRVRAVILSYKADPPLCNLIEKLGIDIIKTPANSTVDLPKQIDDHPDMLFHPFDENTFFVAREILDHYNPILRCYNIRTIGTADKISCQYPEDAILNIARIEGYYIHREDMTDTSLKEALKNQGTQLISVKQGYAKCSVVILEDAIITSDVGIHKKVSSCGVKSYLIPPDGISLEGYKTGFIGGTCGMIGPRELLFSGNIEDYEYYDILISILKKENICPIYPRECELKDLGSIIGVV